MNCPKCIGQLKKVEVKFYEVPEVALSSASQVTTIEVDQCFVCQGIWFDVGELEDYLGKKFPILDSPGIGRDLIQELDKKIGKCPRCNIDMVKKPSPINKDIIMDVCEKCKGIWLDSTEMDRIEASNLSAKEKFGLFLNKMRYRKEK